MLFMRCAKEILMSVNKQTMAGVSRKLILKWWIELGIRTYKKQKKNNSNRG